MKAPRLEIRLDRIRHNARTLVTRLQKRGLRVTGVTKATLGCPEIADEMLAAGVTAIGDSRIANLESLRRSGRSGPLHLIRSPRLSCVDRVVAAANSSHNTEPHVLEQLSKAAHRQGRLHEVLLMVELGDLREGMAPSAVEALARQTLQLPNLRLRGIGANLACQNGVSPSDENMAVLSLLATTLERDIGCRIPVVSGGNSASLGWALTTSALGRVNELRLGESILLGTDPLHNTPIEGLHTDAIRLVGEVIEVQRKPSVPWGVLGLSTFPAARRSQGTVTQAIVALGRQDVDVSGLRPPMGIALLGAGSDHTMLDVGDLPIVVGSQVVFALDYSAMLRAMTSPFVSRSFLPDRTQRRQRTVSTSSRVLDSSMAP